MRDVYQKYLQTGHVRDDWCDCSST